MKYSQHVFGIDPNSSLRVMYIYTYDEGFWICHRTFDTIKTKIGYRTTIIFWMQWNSFFIIIIHTLSRFSFSPPFCVYGIWNPTCHYYDLANHLKLSCVIFIQFPSVFFAIKSLLVFAWPVLFATIILHHRIFSVFYQNYNYCSVSHQFKISSMYF